MAALKLRAVFLNTTLPLSSAFHACVITETTNQTQAIISDWTCQFGMKAPVNLKNDGRAIDTVECMHFDMLLGKP
jgi:hypothetical protein